MDGCLEGLVGEGRKKKGIKHIVVKSTSLGVRLPGSLRLSFPFSVFLFDSFSFLCCVVQELHTVL